MTQYERSQMIPAVDLRDAQVLLVADVADSAQAMSGQLTEFGFQVLLASSPPQAKQRVLKQVPDVVILDLSRAEMDSFELCRQLKMMPMLRPVPVLLITTPTQSPSQPPDAPPRRPDAALTVRAFRLGASDHIVRPFPTEELLVRIEYHIRQGRKLRDLEKEKGELQRVTNELKRAQQAKAAIFANPSDLPPGFILDEKYRLDGRIGLGGFGVVYRATHLQLQRAVAVKVFRPLNNLSTEEAVKRFRQEGTSASRLNHPNAVAMLDSGIAPGGIPYLAMELLVGRTLDDELREKGALALSRCMQIILPVCDVLIEAHAAGIVHRDIKPENVFLHRTRFGEVIKVLDFGIAKLLGGDAELERPNVTGGGGILGTPTYMAPERLRHGPYDGRSDVYSVGVMLYQMLCGRVPFPATEGQGYLEVMLSHLNQQAPPLRQWNPKVPEPVAALVMRTLEKDPAQRPTARELLSELVRVVRQTVGMLDFSTGPSPLRRRSEEALAVLRGVGIAQLPSAESDPPSMNSPAGSGAGSGSSPPGLTSPPLREPLSSTAPVVSPIATAPTGPQSHPLAEKSGSLRSGASPRSGMSASAGRAAPEPSTYSLPTAVTMEIEIPDEKIKRRGE